jgi:hypothetical protein
MIQQGLCTVFLQDCLSGRANFAVGTSYTYKIALYTALADLGPSTTTYASTTNEVPTGGGYTTTGQVLTVIPPKSSDQVAYVSFANVIWNPASFTCRGALIYNSTTGAAVAVLDFGSDKTAVNTFTVTFPADTSSDAVIRLSQ